MQSLTPGAVLLHGFALSRGPALVDALTTLEAAAAFRHCQTPGGFSMSVGMINCGSVGWVSDRRGYRYQSTDPATGRPWPPMPRVFRDLARDAADMAAYPDFDPDACLINRYVPGARMSLHQDKNEADFRFPIVSVSLGLPAVFQFGGELRSAKPLRIPLRHGDVVVFGGLSRLRYHGVSPVKAGHHPILGGQRINLTFRRAL
jgi:alkylated DNA repair protein (DNA oxidative demethylase)